MSNDLTTGAMIGEIVQQEQPGRRQLMAGGLNAGAVTIETERAIAETRAQIMVAKSCPRDINAAYAELMDSCGHMAMATVAFYSRPQGGKNVTGPSIRLAEECVRVMGNIEYGHRELSRDDVKSEVEVYVWDKQTNNRRTRQITVMHVIDRREGPRPTRDQAEIDAKVSNIASKQMRGLMFSMVPPWFRAAAEEKCRATIAKGGAGEKSIGERVRAMTQAFAKYGVTPKHIEIYLEHTLDMCTADELVDMLGIYSAIQDGAKPSEYFSAAAEPEEKVVDPTAAALANATGGDEKGATVAERRRKAPVSPEQKAANAAALKEAAGGTAAQTAPAQEETKKVEPTHEEQVKTVVQENGPDPAAAKPAPAAAQAAPPSFEDEDDDDGAGPGPQEAVF